MNSTSYGSHYQRGYDVQKYWVIRHRRLLGRQSNSGPPPKPDDMIILLAKQSKNVSWEMLACSLLTNGIWGVKMIFHPNSIFTGCS